MNPLYEIDSDFTHPKFDMYRAEELFRGEDLELSSSSSPRGLAMYERFRDEYGLRQGTSVACDAFVFGFGNPPRPDISKVGGQPFWPMNRSWPHDQNGNPLYFLAQINFSDSSDLVRTPKPLLLILSDSNKDGEWFCINPEHLSFVWCDTDVEREEQILVSTVSRYEYFATIHRTEDYPELFDAKSDSLSNDEWESLVLDGPKIGGSPKLVYDIPRGKKGFLFQLGPIWPFWQKANAWVNSDEAFDDYEKGFNVVDLGVFAFFLMEDGSVTWHFESS